MSKENGCCSSNSDHDHNHDTKSQEYGCCAHSEISCSPEDIASCNFDLLKEKITISDSANQAFLQFLSMEETALGIRFEVTTGCKGQLKPALELSTVVTEDDLSFEMGGVIFVIRKNIAPLWENTTIDYSEEYDGFKIENSNFAKSCGNC